MIHEIVVTYQTGENQTDWRTEIKLNLKKFYKQEIYIKMGYVQRCSMKIDSAPSIFFASLFNAPKTMLQNRVNFGIDINVYFTELSHSIDRMLITFKILFV